MKVISLRSLARSAESLGGEAVLVTHQGRVIGQFVPGDSVLDRLIAKDRDEGDLRNAIMSASGFGQSRPAPKTGSAPRPAHPEPGTAVQIGAGSDSSGAEQVGQAGLDPVGERTEAPHLGGSAPPADRSGALAGPAQAPVRRSSFRPAPKPGKS